MFDLKPAVVFRKFLASLMLKEMSDAFELGFDGSTWSIPFLQAYMAHAEKMISKMCFSFIVRFRVV